MQAWNWSRHGIGMFTNALPFFEFPFKQRWWRDWRWHNSVESNCRPQIKSCSFVVMKMEKRPQKILFGSIRNQSYSEDCSKNLNWALRIGFRKKIDYWFLNQLIPNYYNFVSISKFVSEVGRLQSYYNKILIWVANFDRFRFRVTKLGLVRNHKIE